MQVSSGFWPSAKRWAKKKTAEKAIWGTLWVKIAENAKIFDEQPEGEKLTFCASPESPSGPQVGVVRTLLQSRRRRAGDTPQPTGRGKGKPLKAALALMLCCRFSRTLGRWSVANSTRAKRLPAGLRGTAWRGNPSPRWRGREVELYSHLLGVRAQYFRERMLACVCNANWFGRNCSSKCPDVHVLLGAFKKEEDDAQKSDQYSRKQPKSKLWRSFEFKNRNKGKRMCRTPPRLMLSPGRGQRWSGLPQPLRTVTTNKTHQHNHKQLPSNSTLE